MYSQFLNFSSAQFVHVCVHVCMWVHMYAAKHLQGCHHIVTWLWQCCDNLVTTIVALQVKCMYVIILGGIPDTDAAARSVLHDWNL